ncbi:TetR/AcrR family transcriptional regulator [Dictyobacter kobayashii]|uniref:Transcriptional regulator n=1 Tax=Dictyobacter kobayashii TaxID=2014872 RepID=A0A402ATM2_9CHLR|nr:TetR/AcrR family transcriptional regulator [Dictyobacter kobayashii]GCE22383.1 transcriptional regulator [Dictyobacter kobayashii]
MVESASYRSETTALRRQAILMAALKLFATRGYTETTMEDIRQLSGASTGSIYHHFENKEKLALALYLEGRKGLNSHLQAIMDTPGLSLEEVIKTLVSTYLGWFAANPDLGQYIIQADSTEYLSAQVQSLQQSSDAVSQHIMAWLRPFIDDGSIALYPDQLYVPLLLGPSREFVRRWLKTRQNSDFHTAQQELARAAWHTLRPSH